MRAKFCGGGARDVLLNVHTACLGAGSWLKSPNRGSGM